VKGSISVSFDADPGLPGPDLAEHLIKHEFQLVEEVKDLNLHLRSRIAAFLSGEEDEVLTAAETAPIDQSTVSIDEGFVYMSNSHSGMQTEKGDYVMYRHVAIPSSLHQHLLSKGIRPRHIQDALELHDSNPDVAINWLLNNKNLTKSTFVFERYDLNDLEPRDIH
jgi:hypothetical protein